MYKVGLTGGIGSGKSYIAHKFSLKGIPVYYADKEAKRLMYKNLDLKSEIKNLLGAQAYHNNGRLDRRFVALQVFNDKKLLKRLNSIVHPAVADDFNLWANNQKALYVIEESALIFEINSQKNFNKTILVFADEDVRIKRVMQRDQISKKQILARIDKQWKDQKKKKLADYIIENNGQSNIDIQIEEIHKTILKELK